MTTSIQTIWKKDNRKILQTAGYYAAFICLGMTGASMGPTLPGLAQHTHTNLSEISFLFTARSLGYLLGSLRGGRWYDRIAGHRIQALALLGMAALMALVPVIPWLWLLVIALILLGFSESAVDVGGNTLLVWVHRDQVGPFMNGLHLFFGVGSFIAPVIIAQAALWSGDITWGYWALALLLLPVVIYIARQPSPAIQSGAREGQTAQGSTFLIVLIMLFFFLNVGAEGSFGGWIFTYARAENIGTELTAAYLTSAFWGALTLGRLISIPLATRVHPRWILLADLLGCLASLSVILLFRGSFAAVWAGSFGAGLFMASVFPTTITLAERFLPINGKTTGLFFVGASAGSMFCPWLIGQLFEPVGPHAAMIVIFSALILALGVYLILTMRTKQSAG